MVGLENGHIHKNLTQNWNPRDLGRKAEEEEEEVGYNGFLECETQ